LGKSKHLIERVMDKKVHFYTIFSYKKATFLAGI